MNPGLAVLLLLGAAMLVVLLLGVLIAYGAQGVGRSEGAAARRRIELDAAAGHRRLTVVRNFLPNDGHDHDAA